MIGRLVATAGAFAPIAAAAMTTAKVTAVPPAPTIWHLLGYGFEAGPMIAALCACAAVRFYVVQKDHKKHQWTLDAPISALVLMFTASAVIRMRPDPSMALIYGTGLGVLGAGIITLAKKHVDRLLSMLGLGDNPTPPTA